MNSLKKTLGVVLLSLMALLPTQAQDTNHLRWIELEPFTQVQVQLDAYVILVKSSRNHITLQGDSATIADFEYVVEDGILSLDHLDAYPGDVDRVLIEYTDLDIITTGGTGDYFFTNVDQKKLYILNPSANIYLEGNARDLNLISFDGTTDLSKLSSRKEVLFVGESAQVINASQRAKTIVFNDN